MGKPQLQNLPKINHMQNTWFLKGQMEKYIQFLKRDMAYLITFFLEKQKLSKYTVSSRCKADILLAISFLCCSYFRIYLITLFWHCHRFNWESLHKCFSVLPKIRKCSLVLTIWLEEQREPFVSEKSMTGWPACTYTIPYWGTPPRQFLLICRFLPTSQKISLIGELQVGCPVWQDAHDRSVGRNKT